MYNIVVVIKMAYTTIFKTKPKKENKIRFCNRIIDLLQEIDIKTNDNNIISGYKMLNYLFKYSKVNTGYTDIEDLLFEANENYCDIFDLCKKDEHWITDEEILANIEIVVNCFYSFKDSKCSEFWNKEKALKNIEIMFNAIRAFLLDVGYKLVENEDRLCIVNNEIAIDMEEIEDEKLKSEIISFYDYKNANDVEEKKKIMLILIGKLESRKKDIEKLLGSKIADMFSNYANNLNLRHNNISESYKKYYNKAVADLSEEEIVKWYDYVFAFMINIYMTLDNVKDVNVNGGFK